MSSITSNFQHKPLMWPKIENSSYKNVNDYSTTQVNWCNVPNDSIRNFDYQFLELLLNLSNCQTFCRGCFNKLIFLYMKSSC